MGLESVSLINCKRVRTFDGEQQENGFLVELAKQGTGTLAYITSIAPGGHKGYHLHKRRSCNFVVLKGTVRVVLVDDPCRQEFDLTDQCFQRLHVPPGIALALKNLGDEEAWVFNHSEPPYDPAEANEQVERSFEEIENRFASIH